MEKSIVESKTHMVSSIVRGYFIYVLGSPKTDCSPLLPTVIATNDPIESRKKYVDVRL